MDRFFTSACNFWKQGCCGCVRNTKDKEKQNITIENQISSNPNAETNTTEEVLNIIPEVHRSENNTSAKYKKPDSPPKQKRQIKVWTEEEDYLLKVLYAKYGANNWIEIAKHISGRNASQCSQRWRRKYKPEKIRKNWTVEEDNLLKELVVKYGQNWQLISNNMKSVGNRTGKQVRERYLNKLDPKISREPFSEEEDKIIFEQYTKIGKKWSEISKHLHGRPENTVKNRYYSHIKRKLLRESNEKDYEKIENNEVLENLEIEDFEENESSDQDGLENGAIEEIPEAENIKVENEMEIEEVNENPNIKIENIETFKSTKIIPNSTNNFNNFEPAKHLYEQQPSIGLQLRMDIEEMMLKPFDHKMSLEDRKDGYYYNEAFKGSNNLSNNLSNNGLAVNYNESSNQDFHKGFSTETEKLLRSNTFEKVESINSNNEYFENNSLKLKEQNIIIDGSNHLKSQQEEFHIENYLNNEMKGK